MTKSRDLGNLAQTVAVNLPTALGTAGQALVVNSGADGLEFVDASAGVTVKAYANYSSSGTVTLREGGNISSLTDNGTGNTQANFTNSFANDDWAAGLAAVSAQVRLTSLSSQTASAIRLLTENDSGANIDDDMVTFVIVGELS